MKRLWIFLTLFSCKQYSDKVLVQNIGFAQGTTYNIQYMSPNAQDYQLEIDSILAKIDSSLSNYQDYSLISKLNQGDTNLILDVHFVNVFKAFQAVSKSTNGSFDCTLESLVNAWGFGSSEKENLDSNKIFSLLQNTGHNKLSLIGDSALYNPDLVKLDFNALAQGYTVDVIAAYFDSLGLQNYMVELGGELKTKGKNANNKYWRIGIDRPSQEIDLDNRFQIVVKLSNRSLATSGNYRKFYIKEGKKYAHVIDPKTGYPVKHTLLSVTVVTKDCMLADAYATAFMVMGVEKTKKYLANNSDLEAFLIFTNKKGKWETWFTPGFNDFRVN